MLRDEAIKLLGGSASSAADFMGVTYQAVNKWPDQLPPRISDRVLGACVRNGLVVPARFIETEQEQTPTTQAPAAINPAAQEMANV